MYNRQPWTCEQRVTLLVLGALALALGLYTFSGVLVVVTWLW